MKQILVYEPGGPEAMTLADVPTPVPPPGHVLVAIHVSGVNFLDVYFRTGLYKSDHPIAIGSEAAGVIEAVGEGVSDLEVGERVAYTMVRGTYAEYAAVPAVNVIRIPDALTFETAAAVMLQGTTAHYLTRSTFPLDDTHACLVHAAAGGAGGLVVQMAKARGRVGDRHGVARRPRRRRCARSAPITSSSTPSRTSRPKKRADRREGRPRGLRLGGPHDVRQEPQGAAPARDAGAVRPVERRRRTGRSADAQRRVAVSHAPQPGPLHHGAR